MSVDFSKKKILVIEDFADMRGLIKHMLLSFSANNIDMAPDGDQAVTMMKKSDYDIVLCDYNLGDGKDGQQVLEEGRHNNLIRYSTVFIMLTAENTSQMVMGAIEYKPDDYLSKPFNKHMLKNRLEKNIEKKADLNNIEKEIKKNHYAKAVALCDEKISEKPTNLMEVIKLKAQLCASIGRYDEAETIYNDVLSKHNAPWAHLGKGIIAFHRDEFDESAEIFQSLIEQNNNYMEAYDWLAKTQAELGDMDEAKITLTNATAKSPKAILRQMNLGDLAMQDNDFKLAEKAFKSAVVLGKDSVYKSPENYTKQAKAIISNTDHKNSSKEAFKVLQKINKDFPDDITAKLHATVAESNILSDLGRDDEAGKVYQQTCEIYEQVARNIPAELSLDMAKISIINGDAEKGTKIIQNIVSNNHDNEKLLSSAQAVFDDTNMHEEGETIITSSKNKVIKLNNEGVDLARENKLDEAIKLFERALEKTPSNKVIMLNTAHVLLQHVAKNGTNKSYLRQARTHLEQIKNIDPTDSKLQALSNRYEKLSQK